MYKNVIKLDPVKQKKYGSKKILKFLVFKKVYSSSKNIHFTSYTKCEI